MQGLIGDFGSIGGEERGFLFFAFAFTQKNFKVDSLWLEFLGGFPPPLHPHRGRRSPSRDDARAHEDAAALPGQRERDKNFN